MNMARSTFYKRPHAGHRAAREKADTDLRVRIEDILAEFPAYGYRRVTHELRRRGLVINHKRVARVMREHALTPHRVRAWLATTKSDHKQPIYPNLRSSITPEGPDELWVADLTYIRLTTGFVFLAVVLDAWSRRVIGYAISHLLDTRLCLAALDAALDLRQPRAGLVHHSDRGVQPRFKGSSQQHGVKGLTDPVLRDDKLASVTKSSQKAFHMSPNPRESEATEGRRRQEPPYWWSRQRAG